MSAPTTLRTPPAPAPSPRTPRSLRVVGVLTGVALVVGLGVGYLALRPDDHQPEGPQSAAAATVVWGRPVVKAQGMASTTGVSVTQVAITGGGELVDLRYQVVDPTKAATLHDPATPPAVVEEDSGLVIHQLLMNHAHTGAFHAGETYYLVFTNPQNRLQRGDYVTVLLGNSAIEHVLVQ